MKKFHIEKGSTWVAKTKSSPIAKKTRNPFWLLNRKAPKQNAPPTSVVTERSLNAFDRELFMKSRAKPPAKVPTIPHTIVIPPNIISAFVWQQSKQSLIKKKRRNNCINRILCKHFVIRWNKFSPCYIYYNQL